MLPGKLSFASPSDPACYATVPGCGRSYAFRVAAVDANGHESAFSDPSPVVQTYNDPPVVSISAGSGNVTGTSVGLTASVSDDGLNDGLTETLTYAWSVTPPSGGDAWFDDDTSTTPNLYFTAAGSYSVALTVRRRLWQDGRRNRVGHRQPHADEHRGRAGRRRGASGGAQSFTADGIDQFGDDYATLTSGVTWSVGSGGGSITSGGGYSAPALGVLQSDATFTVTATSTANSSITATANVAVKMGSHRLLDFEQLPTGDIAANQYPDATFSCQSGLGYEDDVVAGDWGLSGHFLCTDPPRDGAWYDHDLYVSFPHPVNNLSFLEECENSAFTTPIYTVNVFENYNTNWASPDATVPVYGHTTGEGPGSQTVNLSAYANVTAIGMVNIVDEWGLWWDDFAFDVGPAILGATVSGTGTGAPSVTAIDKPASDALTDAAIRDLYLGTDANGAAAVNFSAGFDPATFGGVNTDTLVHVTIVPADADGVPNGSAIRNGTYHALQTTGGLADIPLGGVSGARDYLATVWLDLNQNGAIDSGEDARKIGIHLADASIGIDANGDGVIDSTDDALEAQGPAPINFEGLGPRTMVVLEGGFDMDADGYKIVLRNVPGLEFWDASTDGNRLWPDADGYIWNDSLASGEETRTLWCSGDPRSPSIGAGPVPIEGAVQNPSGKEVVGKNAARGRRSAKGGLCLRGARRIPGHLAVGQRF